MSRIQKQSKTTTTQHIIDEQRKKMRSIKEAGNIEVEISG